MNTISAYHHAARLEDQASSLLDKISEFRLANYADQSIDWDRLKRFHRAVIRRYQRRGNARQAAFEAYLNEFEKYQTQQIASAVEREAFPPSPVFVHESEYSFNDEYNQVVDDEEELNSGDTFAAPLANAPELAQAGQGSTTEQRAEQGSGSSYNPCQGCDFQIGRYSPSFPCSRISVSIMKSKGDAFFRLNCFLVNGRIDVSDFRPFVHGDVTSWVPRHA